MKGKRWLAFALSAAMVFSCSGTVMAEEALYLLDTDSRTDISTMSYNSMASTATDSLCVRRGNAYYFSYTLKSGDADLVVYYGRTNDEVLIGDWDGDGIDSVCVRRGNTYYFKNDFSGGDADTVVYYGRSDDEVVVGDWDGDGIDTLAVRRGNTYYISNTIKSGNADNVVYYGRSADTVLAGDWDGDGIDTLAVRRGNTYYISNTIKTGNADNTVYYGRAADEVLVGDWDGDGVDTLTVRRGNIYYICNTIKTGTADQEIYYGRATDEVYAGAWTATPAINNFTSNETNFLVDYESDIIFTAEVYETSESVSIYRDGIFIGYMHDDGLDGDDTQDDGIYSYEIITTAEEAATEIYYAECENNVSGNVTIQYFTMPSEQDEDEASGVFTEISSIEAGYADEDGYVPEDLAQTVINDVADYIALLYEEGTVIDYEVNDDCIIYQMESGLLLVYSPAVQDVDSIGYDASMTVITCQPCLTSYGNYTEDYIAWPEGITSPMDMPDEAAENITDDFSNYTFAGSTDYDDSEVSLSVIQSFSANQVILWHGHGGYSSRYHSFLLTGEDFDWSSWWWDADYFLENIRGYFINNSSTGKVCITSKYITKYCGNMDNSFVYLAACSSGEDSVLSDAFLNKGAVAVVANSKTIKTLYNLTMEYMVISTMATVNSETGNYYTLSEALAVAKDTYGNNDSTYEGEGATPTIFGGSEADNFRFGDYGYGTLSGLICKAVDRTTPISDASIAVYSGDTLYGTMSTGSGGDYSLYIPAGDYKIIISADGYIPFTTYATVTERTTTYMETFLMVEGSEGEEGTASGVISNALTGSGVEGVTLEIRDGWNNTSTGDILVTTLTDTSGAYSVTLPYGNYTMYASKDGFISAAVNIIIQEGTTSSQNGSITPVISGDSFRIVLTWGQNPRDLDSHVYGTLSSGSSFHVYFGDESEYDGDIEVCNLDVDDTSSYGPETITLTMKH